VDNTASEAIRRANSNNHEASVVFPSSAHKEDARTLGQTSGCEQHEKLQRTQWAYTAGHHSSLAWRIRRPHASFTSASSRNASEHRLDIAVRMNPRAVVCSITTASASPADRCHRTTHQRRDHNHQLQNYQNLHDILDDVTGDVKVLVDPFRELGIGKPHQNARVVHLAHEVPVAQCGCCDRDRCP
jgi:hypothetical protein